MKVTDTGRKNTVIADWWLFFSEQKESLNEKKHSGTLKTVIEDDQRLANYKYHHSK